MNLQRTPFLVGLAAAAILALRGPAQPSAGPPATSQAANSVVAAITQGGATGTETKQPGQPASPQASRMEASRREYVHLYRELLGIETPPPPPPAVATQVHGTLAGQSVGLEISSRPGAGAVSDDDLAKIAQTARESCYRLEFMIALVSDPIDSGLASDFDLTMSALQIGLADAGYRLDGQWLPWVDAEAADKKTYREAAGIMLFRRQSRSASAPSSPPASDHHLLAVFVVGEAFKVGIHKTAFENAVQFILALHGQHEKPASSPTPACVAPQPAQPQREVEIPILGPSSSGSVTSLRVALAHAPKAWFRIVSGSASAPDLKEQLEARLPGKDPARVWFSRTVVPDDELARQGLRFLQYRLGWDLDKAALLVERDTAYGSYFSGLTTQPRKDPDPLLAKLTRLTFPSGLYALRNAWEANAGAAPPAQAIAANPQAFATPKTALEVSLADQRTPVDVVPELSPLTARIYDMAMADLLREISREGYSYIGILATDVKDQLFLAEQIRRWAPSVMLFVVDNNLLYVHPQYNTATFGMLTISSFPLVTEGRLPVASPSVSDPRVRRQFASERQEGTYLAMRTLLGQRSSRPAVWISASGNYAMWPLATIPPRRPEDASPPPDHSPDVRWLGPRAPPPPTPDQPAHARQGDGASLDRHRPMRPPREGMDLAPVFLAFVVCLVSYLLQRQTRHWAATQPRTLVLLSCAAALLLLAAGFLVGLWFVKLLPDLSPHNRWDPSACLPLALLAAGYLYLAWDLLAARYPYPGESPRERIPVVSIWWRRPNGNRTRWEPALAAVTWSLVLVLPLALTWGVFRLWHVGGGGGFAYLQDAAGLFYLRARVFSGGISPVIPLAWLAAAGFFWLVVELQRQWVRRRHDPSSCDPSPKTGDQPDARWPLSHYSDPAFKICQAGSQKIGPWLRPTVPPGRGIWLAILAIVGPPIVFLWPRMQPIGESRTYGLVFLVLAAGLSVLSTMAMLRFLRVWAHLRAMLHSIERTDLLAALKAVAAEIGWQPTHFGWYEPSFTAVKQSAERLQGLIDWQLVDPLRIIKPGDRHRQSLPDLLEAIFAAASEQRFHDEVSLRDALNARCNRACSLLAEERGRPAVKEFYAVRLIAYLRHVFHQLRYSVLGAMGCGLALIVGTSTYAFQPKEFATLVLWGTLAAASGALLVVFVQMERDATLSAIGGTDAGKVTYDWHFLSKLLIYNVLPVVGLIVSQFPSVGRLFNGLIDPLLRVVGTG